MKKIKFKINNEACIELASFRQLQHIDLDEAFTAELLYQGNKFLILNDGHYSSEALRNFDEDLTSALSGQAELHESIQDDMGLVWNDYLHVRDKELSRKKFFFEKISEETEQWVGLRYYLWTNPPENLAFWLYAKQGKYFIELTPEYPWALCAPEPDEVVVPYDEFMKNYKPILILEIPREALVRWKRQTGRLMRVVESNEKRIRANFFANRRTRRLRRLARLKRAVQR